MQTFLPYPDLRASSVVLDDRRLGKQRVETYQILRALTWPEYAWKNHPAVRMWRGFVPALVAYGLENCREWTRRGYSDTVAAELLAWSGGAPPDDVALPPWFGLEALHLSHRSALLRKDPEHYRPLFGDEPDDLPYLWPPAAFPRWPVRSGEQALPLDAALRLLGYAEPLPGQAEAVRAVRGGRDCLLAVPPGSGSSTAGLLAGLSVPGRTLWVAPWQGPRAGPVPDLELPPPREVPPPAKRAAPVARAPSAVDLAAMADEARRPEFVFAHPDRLPRAGDRALADVTLVVVDSADRLADDEAEAVAALRRALGRPPVLALSHPVEPALRDGVAARLGLVDPVEVGPDPGD